MTAILNRCAVLYSAIFDKLLLVMILMLLAQPAFAWKMEAGNISIPTTSGTNFVKVSFRQKFDVTPVIFAIATSTGSNPASLRIRNILINDGTTGSFEITIVEPSGEDGPHITMPVHYFAIEPGSYTLVDGTRIEAGTATTSAVQHGNNIAGAESWDAINFSTAFSAMPAFLAQIQTMNNETASPPGSPSVPWLTTAVDNLSANGASIALERSEADNGSVTTTETIGYIGIDVGTGNFTDINGSVVNFQGLATGNNFNGWDNGCDTATFAGGLFSAAPLAFATKTSYRISSTTDGGWFRRCSLTANSIGLTIDEDRDNDNERNHNPNESAGIIAFAQSFTFDSTVTPPSLDPNWKIEVGIINLPAVAAGSTTFSSVLFQQNYTETPLVFILPSDENPDPAAVRIRNVSTNGFEVAQVEPPPNFGGSNGQPVATVHYLALKPGIHQLPGGINVDAANINTQAFQSKLIGGSSWNTLSYRTSFPAAPVILAQVQTMANETGSPPGAASIPWLGTTISNVTSGSFRLALDRAEVTAGNITTDETIAYLAITSNISNSIIDSNNNSVLFETISSADNITGNCTSVNFANTYPAPPLVIASLNKRDGGDGGWVRRCSIQTNLVRLRVDEDLANDGDRAHTTENAGVAVFERSFAAQFGCGPIPNSFPIYSSGNDLDIKNNVTINVGSGAVGVQQGNNNGNAIDVTNTVGDVISGTLPLPIFEPTTFPATGTMDVDVAQNTTVTLNVSTNPPGDATYNNIRVRQNATLNFTGGGPFYIDRLRTDQNSIINFNAGTYFIDRLEVRGQNVNINVNGAVRLFIGNRFNSNNNADNLSINTAGNVSDLVVFLYPNATFKMDGDNLNFTGVVYGPQSGEIKIKQNSTITGALIGGSDIKLDDDVSINYTAAVANAVANITTCTLSFNHYAISHSGAGITCYPTDVTISAHDASHAATLPASGTTISLSTSTGLGSWTGLSSGTGILTDATLGDGMATYTFNGAENAVTLSFDYPILSGADPETVNINAVDGITSEQEDPDLTISLAALIIDNIPTQISGKPSDMGFGTAIINLKAVRASDNNTSVCVPAFPSGTSRTIEFGGECRSPSTCAGNQINVNGTNIATNNDDGGLLTTSSYTGVSLNFGANATASLILNYPDAGQMQLHARYNIPLANGNPSGTFLTGLSNNYVVRPFALHIPAISGNNAAINSGGAASFTAGVDFSFMLEGILWQAGEDTLPLDGIPDGLEDNDPATNPANISDNGITPNFNASTNLTTTLVAPVGGNNASLSSSAVAISNGSGNATTNWPEVGIIEINADVSDYITAGINITGRSSYVGRFIPDRFVVGDNSPTLANSCGAFSYMDQQIVFASNPAITLTALEEGGGLTLNYDAGGFWKYTANLSSRAYSNNATTPATLDAPALGTVAILGSGDLDGNAAATLAISNDTIAYQRPADPRDAAGGGANPAIPFAANIDLNFTTADLTDTDGVCYDSNNDGNCEAYSVNNIGSTQLRFGRLNIGNAFGSELVNQQLPITIQYYASTTNDFIASAGDTCTALTIAPAGPPSWGHINLSNYQGSLNAGETTPTLSTFIASEAVLTLSAPGLGNQGSVVVTPLLMSGILLEQPWLQFDWDNDGSHDNDPTATATFGIYRGNDSTIYLRELY